jgi:hypothetical protein
MPAKGRQPTAMDISELSVAMSAVAPRMTIASLHWAARPIPLPRPSSRQALEAALRPRNGTVPTASFYLLNSAVTNRCAQLGAGAGPVGMYHRLAPTKFWGHERPNTVLLWRDPDYNAPPNMVPHVER